MPSTTNFNWTTPADTDYVKDGANAIRTLGNGIDTSLVDLKGGTTGQILSKASNTDLDYTWINNDQGDITAVNAGTGISVTGGTGPTPTVAIDSTVVTLTGTQTLTNKTLTAPVVSTISNTGTLTLPTSTDTLVGRATTDTLTNKTINASSNTLTGVINNTLTTTTGDLIYASAANTPARLAIGTSNQVLTVSGGVPTWAAPATGGMTLLDTITLSGSSVTSATFSSSYECLTIYIKGMYGSTNTQCNMRLNADTGSNYSFNYIYDGTASAESVNATSARIGNIGTLSGVKSSTYQIINLMRPKDTDQVFFVTTAQYGEFSVAQQQNCTGVYDCSAAITSITIFPGSGTFTAGTVYIYGVK